MQDYHHSKWNGVSQKTKEGARKQQENESVFE